jgi:hypothetical protein
MKRVVLAVLMTIACRDDKAATVASKTGGSAAASQTEPGAESGAAGSAAKSPEPAIQPGAPGTPYGWWRVPDVEAAEDLRGGAMKLTPHEMTIVTKQGRAAVRTCETTMTGRSVLEVTISGCGPATTAKLVGDELEFGPGFVAARATADEIAKLEQAAKQSSDVCDRARACYRLAWPELGRKLDENADFGPGPAKDVCQALIERAAADLAGAGKRVPPPCAR